MKRKEYIYSRAVNIVKEEKPDYFYLDDFDLKDGKINGVVDMDYDNFKKYWELLTHTDISNYFSLDMLYGKMTKFNDF